MYKRLSWLTLSQHFIDTSVSIGQHVSQYCTDTSPMLLPILIVANLPMDSCQSTDTHLNVGHEEFPCKYLRAKQESKMRYLFYLL